MRKRKILYHTLKIALSSFYHPAYTTVKNMNNYTRKRPKKKKKKNSKELEIAKQPSTMKEVYPHYGILPSNKKEETTDPKTDDGGKAITIPSCGCDW